MRSLQMLLTSPRALSRNLPGYVASRINQPAVHKLAVWVEAGLSSLHFAKLTRTKSLPHYWRTRVRRPRREPADPGNPAFFFLSVRPLRFLSIRLLESADVNTTIRPSVRAWLSRTPCPLHPRSLPRLLRYVRTLDPGPHIVPRDLLRTHTRRILHCSAVGNSSRDPTVLVMVVVGTVSPCSYLDRDRRHIWKRNPEGMIFWICSNVGRVVS